MLESEVAGLKRRVSNLCVCDIAMAFNKEINILAPLAYDKGYAAMTEMESTVKSFEVCDKAPSGS